MLQLDTTVALSNIPFFLNSDQVFEQFRIKSGTDRAKEVEDLVNKIHEIGNPKALYKVCFIDEKTDDSVIVEGVKFISIALRQNLDSVERVFPYIATCGTEMDELEIEKGDILKKMMISYIKESFLQTSIQYLMNHVQKQLRISKLASMNPGSGDATVWPIEQQKDVFSILGDVERLIGVKLTTSSVLQPDMSLSGILFPTETDFETCQLCHREKCPNRRAPFDQELWESINAESPGA